MSEPIEVPEYMLDAACGALEEGWKAAVDVVRDAVLYERYGMAEGGFTGDQINAVLGIIDDYGYAPAAPSANVESEGACKSDR